VQREANEPRTSRSADSLTDALAAELRRLRTRSGKTLRELEEITFSSDSALSRYLSGKAVPPWSVVQELCRVGGGNPDAVRTLWEHARRARSAARDGTNATVRKDAAASGTTPNPPVVEIGAAALATHVRDIRKDITQSEKRIKRTLAWVVLALSLVVQLAVASSGPHRVSAAAAPGYPPASPSTSASTSASPATSSTAASPSGAASVSGLVSPSCASAAPGPGLPSGKPLGPDANDSGTAAGMVRELYADVSGWRSRDTGLPATTLSVVHRGGMRPEILAIQDGMLRRYHNNDGTGWKVDDTGIAALAVSAASAGSTRLLIAIIGTNGTLQQVVQDPAWRTIDTGIRVRAISAVYTANQQMQVIATDDRDNLLQAYVDGDAWKVGRIGLRVNAIAAVYMGGQWPQVMATDNDGRLLQIYGDDTGWHARDTTVRLARNSALAAVNMGGNWPTAMATDSAGRLLYIFGDVIGWHSENTGQRAAAVAAVDTGETCPYTIVA